MAQSFGDVFFDGIAPTPLERILMFEEGYRATPYKDSKGLYTVGYGHKIVHGDTATVLGKEYAYTLLRADIKKARSACRAWDWFGRLDDVRADCVTALVFQLGPTGFGQFKKCIAALDRGDYTAAAGEILDSLYSKQCPNRSFRVARWLNLGEYPEIPT